MAKLKSNKETNNMKFGTTGYPVGDFLIRIKNAALARRKEILVRRTKIIEAVAKALVKEGYLTDVKRQQENLSVSLVYRKKEPLMLGMKLISKPGLRVFLGVEDLEKRRAPSTLLISTPKGVVSGRDAIKARVGGEVIVEVW